MSSLQKSGALAFTRPPHALAVEPVVRAALEEDLGRAGDITSQLTIPADKTATARLVVDRSAAPAASPPRSDRA